MPDVETVCIQCKEKFLFTEKEQEIFYQRNQPSPQRCEKCRSKKAVKSENSADRSDRFEIVCDNCGRHDRVPFQPKVGRTVMCRECHEASRSRARYN